MPKAKPELGEERFTQCLVKLSYMIDINCNVPVGELRATLCELLDDRMQVAHGVEPADIESIEIVEDAQEP